MPRSMAVERSSLAISPSIPVEIQRQLRALQQRAEGIAASVKEQDSKIASKVGSSQADLLGVSQFVRNQLQANGAYPLALSNLPGSVRVVDGKIFQNNQEIVLDLPGGTSVGTHADRIGLDVDQQSTGLLFLETDRDVIYVVAEIAGEKQWVYGTGFYTSVQSDRPIDLASNDQGYLFFATDEQSLARWDGSAWVTLFSLAQPSLEDLISVNGEPVGTAGLAANGLVIGFLMLNGIEGVNVGPMLLAPHLGALERCSVIVKASDLAIDLQFSIRKNGTPIFTTPPTIAAGAPIGSLITFTGLTALPLPAVRNDVFTIDILSGTRFWQFTAQLE